MKQIKIEISFNVKEKDFKHPNLTELLRDAKNGTWAKELLEDCDFNPQDLKIKTTTK